MTDDHRPRPASGVMGYVARYQQFDPEATDAGPDGSGDVPSDRGGNSTVVFARPDERLIDLSAPRPAPVAHRRQGQIRRGVLVLAALAVMAAGGAGYVLLRTTGHDESTAASTRRTAEAPTPTSVVPGDGSAPNGEPVHTVPTVHVAASATTTPPPATVVTTAPTVISVLPLPTVGVPVRTGTPVRTSAPASTIAPAPTDGSASASAPVSALTATYSYRTDDDDAAPITGYVGTIRVTNPDDTAAGSWTVRLTVPSGITASVETGDVTVSRDGDRLSFRPTVATIAAHGSVTFTFTLSDPLTALPGACTVGGADCD